VGDRVCTHREPRILTTCERRSLSPCHSRANGDGSWAEPPLQTAHRRIPTEGVRCRTPLSCFRPPPLVPGLSWFRARVILRTDGPTRPIQRLPVPGTVPPFPHPEPPLLFVLLGVAPSPGPNRGLSQQAHMDDPQFPGRSLRRSPRGSLGDTSDTFRDVPHFNLYSEGWPSEFPLRFIASLSSSLPRQLESSPDP
jgi:hypothetical protein